MKKRLRSGVSWHKNWNLYKVGIQTHTCIDISMQIADSMHSLAPEADSVFAHLLEIQNRFYILYIHIYLYISMKHKVYN